MRLISKNIFIGILSALIGFRLLLSAILPLTETTEARYGEIARKMLETGNWVNLLDTYHSPFWAKPPLYSWLSASSMAILGISEFSIRLPSMLLAIATLTLVYQFTKDQLNIGKAQLATIALLSGAGFLVASSTVMTDPSLLFSVALGLCSWWRHHQKNQPIWAYAFFAAIGLGLVAKGPLAIVLIGMPIFFYLLIKGGWIKAIKELPWIGGIFIGILIPSIWYFAAEAKTPGFLEYFLLGEHVYRFIKPGWTGDLYGTAHAQPKGTIWVYASISLLPWSFFLIIGWIKKPIASLLAIKESPLRVFLLCWILSHLIFFSLPANIIWPYYLPMAPAFAILFADLIGDKPILSKWLAYFSVVFISLALAVGFYFAEIRTSDNIKSGKNIIQLWEKENPTHDSQLNYLSGKRLFSLEFYSSGRAIQIKSQDAIRELIKNKSIDFLLINKDEYKNLPTDISKHFIKLSNDDDSALHLVLLKEID